MGDYLERVHEQYAHILAFLQRYDWAAVPKPAVVMDIDETAICNIRGARWRGHDMTRRAIPGAVAVANYLAMRGVAVYFVSARPHTALEFSTRQLHAEGFKFRMVVHQNRERQPDYGAYKRGARALIAKHHTIVAAIGDQPADIDSHARHGFLIHNPHYTVPATKTGQQ